MKEFFKQYKGTLVIALLIGAAFFAYQSFFVDTQTDDFSVSTGGVPGSVVGQEVVALLAELESITLDISIFSDPSFVSLYNFGQVVNPEVVGRSNPFAPIGSDRDAPRGIATVVEEENDIVKSIRIGKEAESTVEQNEVEDSATDGGSL